MARDIKINTLPAPTWTWLRVNDVNIKLAESFTAADISVENAAGVTVSENDADLESGIRAVETGMGSEMAAFVDGLGLKVKRIEAAEGTKAESFVSFKAGFTDGQASLYEVYAGKNSELKIFIDNYSTDESEGSGLSDIRFRLEEGSKVTLIQVFRQNSSFDFYDNIGADLGKRAELRIVHIVSGTRNLYLGATGDQKGDKSYFGIDTGYIRKASEKLDINYVARQRGKQTESSLKAGGVLRDTSYKCFRATIDFINGCTESKGDEREEVLLMDPDVVNKTIPLILCAEDDVEGTHGASIGRLDEDIIFYFKSRGMTEDQIMELMAASKLINVINLIDDENLRASVRESLEIEAD